MKMYLFGKPTEDVLSPHRRAQVRVFCEHTLLEFKNVLQAGRYALQTLRNAGDTTHERRAILREIWVYHRRIVTGEIPFTLLLGVGLWLLTGCTPY